MSERELEEYLEYQRQKDAYDDAVDERDIQREFDTWLASMQGDNGFRRDAIVGAVARWIEADKQQEE